MLIYSRDHHNTVIILQLKINRDFPGGPAAKTLHSQCRGPGFKSLVRELDPTCCN